ncbi:MAG: VCBS repeat-containing protein [Archangium sp.]|nr:VCBS repeat-containing protein [Archangium sp.]
MRRALPCLLVLLACRGPITRQIEEPPPPPPPTCGDGLIQEGEDCDASDPGTATCQSLGFDTGRLVCSSTCRYDTTLCVRRCGNGVLDLGEACDGALGVVPCTTWGFNACTSTCAVDTRRCVVQPFENGPEMDISKGGPAVLGDLAPRGPGDLVMAVPAFARVEIVPWSMTQGFEAVSSRKLSFLREPVRAELLDANGDGNTDVASINLDGTFDLMIYGGTTYSLSSLDAGCAGATFLPSNGTPGSSLVAVGCGGYAVVSASGAALTATPASTAVTRGPFGVIWADGTPGVHLADGGVSSLPRASTQLGSADLDGDGDEDLVAVTSAGIELFENSGVGFAARATFTATSPGELRVLDLDQDGLPDLFWATGDDLVVRRNRAGWIFTETRVPAGAGARKSTAIGDADGDQDLDFAVTISTGTDSTKTRVFLNRVR